MKTLPRILELLLALAVLATAFDLHRRLVVQTAKASYAQGQLDLYNSFAEDPKALKKW